MLQINFSSLSPITTERLRLRRLSSNDANEIMLLRSNSEVNKFLDRPASTTIEEAEKFINKIETSVNSNESLYLAITLTKDSKLIGTICLWNISIEKSTAEIGFELLPEFHGQGIMQEAITSIITLAFNQMHFKVITAFVKSNNQKSIALLRRNNFTLDKDFSYGNKDELEGYEIYYLENRMTV
jgi:ribosomal-protein-alanine N-acetyltransferase